MLPLSFPFVHATGFLHWPMWIKKPKKKLTEKLFSQGHKFDHMCCFFGLCLWAIWLYVMFFWDFVCVQFDYMWCFFGDFVCVQLNLWGVWWWFLWEFFNNDPLLLSNRSLLSSNDDVFHQVKMSISIFLVF
jgi:hypothetical protein